MRQAQSLRTSKSGSCLGHARSYSQLSVNSVSRWQSDDWLVALGTSSNSTWGTHLTEPAVLYSKRPLFWNTNNRRFGEVPHGSAYCADVKMKQRGRFKAVSWVWKVPEIGFQGAIKRIQIAYPRMHVDHTVSQCHLFPTCWNSHLNLETNSWKTLKCKNEIIPYEKKVVFYLKKKKTFSSGNNFNNSS